ncbi:LysM peptidoglycan-binding domain-containing protein [bacterium]|nr:LysM peptidoglycan-binding domain-containing protein [bacterium]
MNNSNNISCIMLLHAAALLSVGIISGCASQQTSYMYPQPRIRDDFGQQSGQEYAMAPQHMYPPEYSANTFPLVEEPISGSYAYHTVQKGETLYAISRQYGKNFSEIARANNLNDANTLRVGQRIIIPGADSTVAIAQKTVEQPVEKVIASSPAPSYKPLPASMVKQTTTYAIHTVQRGDNIERVAQKYDVSTQEICQANGLEKTADLNVGQKIKIPVN